MKRPTIELLDVASLQDWLQDVRDAGLDVLATILLGACYAWILYLFFTLDNFQITFIAPFWLLIFTVLAMVLRTRAPRLALPALTGALFGATLIHAWAAGLPATIYLIVPSAFLAGLFFAPRRALLAQSLLGLGIMLIGWQVHRAAPFSAAMFGPLIALAETSLATWVSSRSLRSALDWAVEGYSHALEQTQAAQERRAQLRQAYSSLDEASYRLQRMNYELTRALDAAESLRRLKQEFVASISHELRTPLAMIVGFSEMIYMAPENYGTPLPAEYLGDVREIYRNSQHLIGLIDDILDLSRISAGRMQLSRSETDLRELVLDAANIIRPLVEGKGLALKTVIEGDIGPAYLDPTRIRQVLLNLLNNARRFTEQGSITVGLRIEGEQAIFSVADTGIGIVRAEQVNVFERFRQVDGTLTRGYEGAGLGLAISKEFVEMHGGRIWLESEGVSGRGSTFFFALPLQSQEAGVALLQATARRGPHAGPLPKLLLLAQDADVLAPVQRFLSAYEVVWVPDAEEVAAAVERHAPVAVLLNPAPQGELEELRRLRAHLGESAVPVLWFPFGAERVLARSLGVNSYLVKPVRRETVLKALADLGDGVRRVMIVDDDPRVVQLLTRMIRSDSTPFEVLHAYNGREGLELLRSEGADAIILDLIMPEVDGRAFIQEVRQEPRFRELPIVVVTAKAYDVDDSPNLSGNLLGLGYSRGLHNQESLTYIARLLETLQVVQPIEAAISE